MNAALDPPCKTGHMYWHSQRMQYSCDIDAFSTWQPEDIIYPVRLSNS
jgi:hypothetical protein